MTSKADRGIARSVNTRESRAKHEGDRNLTPPVTKYAKASKRKNRGAARDIGQRGATEAQLGPDENSAGSSPAAGTEIEKAKDPWWSTEREKCYQMVLLGIPQGQIARELDRDRHTVAEWTNDDRFILRLQDENLDLFASMRQRRAVKTTFYADKVAKQADDAFKELEAKPRDLATQVRARAWLQEFREQTRREDEVYGVVTQRMGVDVNVRGSMQHRHTAKIDVTFKQLIVGALIKSGVDVDKEEIDPEKAQEMLVMATERALHEGTFLDDMVERERQLKLEAPPVER